MGTVTLEQKELETLKEILWSYLGDLRFEIADTDSKDWRDYLKEKEVIIKQVITKLEKAK
ncbi:MAG: hypothetical protein GXO99_08570 [Nitrospirae bacterium]|nr:hypothetical protein [Nitrospirota bacterium]